MPDRRPLRSWSIATTVVGLLLAASGAAWWSHSGRTERIEQSAPAATTAGRGPLPRPRIVASRPGAPLRIRIPALRVDSRVVAVRAPGGTLVPPSDPQEVGWWAGSPEPGSGHGSTLIAGHTVHEGGGALDHLATLRRGDVVVVTTTSAALRYRVSAVHVYSKGALASHARRLFARSGAPRLVVVTCSDWNGTVYLSNTVATALPTTRRSRA